MSEQDPAPKLQIDSDWKAEAQAEKERLAAKEAENKADADGPGAPGELPEANFKSPTEPSSNTKSTRLLSNSIILGSTTAAKRPLAR